MFDNLDEKKTELLTSALMFGGGAICWFAAVVGHVAFGALLVKIGTSLMVWGGIRLWRAFAASQTKAPENAKALLAQNAGANLPATLGGDTGHDDPSRLKTAIVWGAAGAALLWAVWPTPKGDFGIFARVFGVVMAYGILRLGHSAFGVALPGKPKSTPTPPRPVQPRRTLGQLWNGEGCYGHDTTASLFDRLCAIIACIGFGAMVISFGCFAISFVFINTQATVITTGRLGFDPDTAIPLALCFAILTGFCWARMLGGTWLLMAIKTPVYGFIAFSLLMVPVAITGDELAEALVFRHASTLNTTYRVQLAEEEIRKGVTHWSAVLDPYQVHWTGRPSVPIDHAAYQSIIAHQVRAPDHSNDAAYGRDGYLHTTDLCLSFNVQRAGTAERIMLQRGHMFTTADLQACPNGAR